MNLYTHVLGEHVVEKKMGYRLFWKIYYLPQRNQLHVLEKAKVFLSQGNIAEA